MASRAGERLVALAIAAALALNYPLLFLIDSESTVLSIPTLYFYLFVCWATVIFLTAVILHRDRSAASTSSDDTSAGDGPDA